MKASATAVLCSVVLLGIAILGFSKSDAVKYEDVTSLAAALKQASIEFNGQYRQNEEGHLSVSQDVLADYQKKREALACRLFSTGQEFISTHAEAPEKWSAIVWIIDNQPTFLEEFKSEACADLTQAEWHVSTERWREDLEAAGALSSELDRDRARINWNWQYRVFAQDHSVGKNKLDVLANRLMDYLATLTPDATAASQPVSLFIRTVSESALTEEEKLAQYSRLLSSSNAVAQRKAKTALDRRANDARREALIGSPVDLDFTALDGRVIRRSSLRGKVVLVDFWATFCTPCIADFPKVKTMYEKFRPAGFEIIGVSLDQAADKKRVIDLLAKKTVPWPQMFPGGGLAKKFSVTSLPDTFLLGRDGKIVAVGLRGEQLEQEIARLTSRDI